MILWMFKIILLEWSFISLIVTLCRRERDNTEVERAQHLSQIHDFQELIQEKEGQILALQEQVYALRLSLFIYFIWLQNEFHFKH